MAPDDEPPREQDESPDADAAADTPTAHGAAAFQDAIRNEAGEGWATNSPALVLAKRTITEWLEDGATTMAAAVAYYTIFSLGPIILLAIAAAGIVFGQGAAWDRVLDATRAVIGPQGAQAVQTIAQSAQRGGGGTIATVVGFVALIFAATGVFAQLQRSLNRAWEIEHAGGGLKGKVWNRILGFFMVLIIGILLVASLVASSAVQFLASAAGGVTAALPGGALVWQAASVVVSLLIITLLFAALYKVLPDARVEWRQLWVGAAFTAILFVIGKEVVAYYLSQRAVASSYGAAGSIIVILLFVYYSALVLFLGAEFTQVWAAWRGEPITPDDDARWLHIRQPPGGDLTRAAAPDEAGAGGGPE